MEYPVIIIGGGPAGSICSLHLSMAGIAHLILESSSFPREKACADILTSKAIREIGKADPLLEKQIQLLPSYNEIWGTTVQIGSKHALDIPYKGMDGRQGIPSCIAVRRAELDELLWRTASGKDSCTALENMHVGHIVKSGALYRINCKDQTSFTTSHIVLATGSLEKLTKNLGFKKVRTDRHTALGLRAYFTEVKGLQTDRCELFLNKDSMPGGFYIAPLGDGSCNVNVVLRKDLVKKKDLNLKKVMEEFYTHNPSLIQRFKDARSESPAIGQALHLGTMKSMRYHDSIFLCGDAGGLIDLISANGIPQALCSARLASQAIKGIIHGSFQSDEAGTWFEAELEQQIASDMKIGRMLSPWMSMDWFNSLILGAMTRAQGNSEQPFLQELLYSDDPWKTMLNHLNPLKSHI